ncbi:MAG TPA: hypothetical protein VFE73_16505 [Reyranella sp.]|jgi:hypothetical protein|nr:hypothetical protein [Reyranella sp.]
MATTTVVSAAPAAATVATVRSVQWGAVILGALVASAICMVLLTFGAGIGLSATSAHPYAGASPKALAVISGLYTAVTLIAAFAGGGYVAGRMRMPAAEELAEHEFRDGAHGFAVWALTLFVAGLMAAIGAGGAVKTAIQATAVVAGGTAGGAASNPQVTSQISTSPTDYAVDRILAPAPAVGGQAAGGQAGAAAPAPATNGPQAAPSRADMVAPVNRIFAASIKSGQLDQNDRATLVAIVQQQTGLPQAEAEKRVDSTYAQLKDAEAKARDAAEKARKAALITAFGVAATLLIGAAAATIGAAAGAHHRAERIAITWFGSRRFW